MVIFEIRNPRSEESDPATFAQILANFANQSPPSLFKKLIGHDTPAIFLEIAAFKQSIHFYLVSADYLHSYFLSQLSSQYPKAQITQSKNYLSQFSQAKGTVLGELKLKESTYLPLQTFRQFTEHDPLKSVLAILSRLKQNQQALIQLALQPSGSSWQESGRKKIEAGIKEVEIKGNETIERRKPLPHQTVIREKIRINGLKTGLRLLIQTPGEKASSDLLDNLAGSFGVYARGDGNSLYLQRPNRLNRNKLASDILKRGTSFIPRSQVLNIEELATLFHPPGEELQGVKEISKGGQIYSEAPENLPISPEEDTKEAEAAKKKINFFAKTEFKNQPTTFGVKKEDRRRHMYVIGKTGTGKTTMIANMAINDMRNGEGVAVIDPHGDLCEILLDYIPSYRINDVAYLDPADTDHPFRLNPLELSDQETVAQAELVASGIVSIFYKLYHYSWGPRMEYIFRHTLLTLAQIPNSTLVDVPRILSDAKFRKKIISKTEDKILKRFWEQEFNQMSPRLRSEAVSPIQNKVGQFVGSPMIRGIIEHPHSTIDFQEMMDEGKIIIANLSQGKLGEDNAALMGAMFITKMQLAAMSRVYQEEEERRDFYLYVDEFQNFATNSFIKILSEARKYRLNLNLANQYIGQVDEEIRKAIFGNIGSLVSFLVGAEDAKRLSFEFGEEYEANEFVSLGKYKVLLKMAIDGITSTPFYAETLPLPYSSNKNREKVIKVSRERYTKSRT